MFWNTSLWLVGALVLTLWGVRVEGGALEDLRDRAEGGDREAQFRLGAVLCGLRAEAGVLNTLRRRADEGDPGAQFDLASAYQRGDGVPADVVEAVKWYRKAAEQGHADAQCRLGVLLSRGGGVSADYVEAYKWCGIALIAGQVRMAEPRKRLESLMTAAQIEEARRLIDAFRPLRQVASIDRHGLLR